MSSYITNKEQFPFLNQEENKQGSEFSKGLTRSMLSANKLRAGAYVEFFLRDVPKSMRNQLAEKFNGAVKSYNRNRHKIIDVIRYGYNPDAKLFTIEEQFGTAAAIFQSIRDILHKYPQKRYEEPKTIHSTAKEEESPADKLRKRLMYTGVIVSEATLLTACAVQAPMIQELPNSAGEAIDSSKDLINNTEDGQEINLETNTQNGTNEVAPERIPTVTPQELSGLSADISDEIQAAADKADSASRTQFEMSQRAEVAAKIFATSLTNPENPADRVLDSNSFSIGITPDGIAYLMIEVDSIWGRAGEVAIVDTGNDKGMFVSLTGAGVENGTLSLDEKGYYAVAKDESGAIVAAVDSSRQWIKNLDQSKKLPEIDISQQMVEAYLNGKIDYPNDLVDEQKAAFENALAAAEANLPYEQQKKLIEDRFEKGSKAYEALIKTDGNLEYYDGRWKTLEAMRNLNGDIIPWGESYELPSEEGQAGLLTNVMAGGHPETMTKLNKVFNNRKNILNEAGLTGDNLKIRYVQFFSDMNEDWQKISREMPLVWVEGQMVIKNSKDKILVIDIKTSLVFTTAATDPQDGRTNQLDPENRLLPSRNGDITPDKYNYLVGIPTSNWLSFKYRDLKKLADEPAEQAYLEKAANFNLDNFLEKLETNPSSINEDLFGISYFIGIRKE